MKKIVIIAMLLAATAARAFDFKTPAPTGQWLYYTIIDQESVKIVNPDWEEHTSPIGIMRIPATVTNSATGLTYNVVAIDAEAFKMCDALTRVTIAQSVSSIGRMAFAYCTVLDSVALPQTLNYIGSMAFTGTPFFASHVNEQGLLITGVYLIGARSTLVGSINVPSVIQGLGNMAFYGCEYIERVTLPDGLRFIGENAFQDCLALDTVEMLGSTPPTLENNAFTNTQNVVILVPYGSGSRYREAANWRNMNIVERSLPIGIDPVSTYPVSVTTGEDGIRLILPEGSIATICDMTGRRIAESKGGHVALPTHGVYIVSIPGRKALKVVY